MLQILEYIEERDRENLINFLKALPQEDLYKRFFTPKIDVEEYVSRIGGREGVILVAYYNNELIGLCEAYRDDGEWETAIIIDRRFRRRGIGKEMLKEAAKLILKRGGRIIYGIIDRSNHSAIEFGKALGADIISLDSRTVKVVFKLEDIIE